MPLPVTMDLGNGLIPGSEIITRLTWTGMGEGVVLEVTGLFGDALLHVDINEGNQQGPHPMGSYHGDFVGGQWSHPEPLERFPFARRTVHTVTIRVAEDESFEFLVDDDLLFSRKPPAPYPVAAAMGFSLWCHGKEVLCIGLYSLTARNVPDRNIFDFTSLLPPAPAPPRVFVGVPSEPKNAGRRQSIRESYMRHLAFQNGEWTLKFFVGRAANPRDNELVEVEARLFGDLVVDLTLEESYQNITRKTLAIFEYGALQAGAEFIFKADDDTFIYVDHVNKLLADRPNPFQYVGKIAEAAAPIRIPESKWYMPYEKWAMEAYPPFAFGSGYLLSKQLAWVIAEGFHRREIVLWPLEDVSVGIWVDNLIQAGVEVEYFHSDLFTSVGCMPGGYIAHNVEHHMMACMWQKVLSFKSLGIDPEHQDYCCQP